MSDVPETLEARLRRENARLLRTLSRLAEERECGHRGICLEDPLHLDLPPAKNPCRKCRILEVALAPGKIPVEDLPLDTRAYNALRGFGCHLLSEVMQIPPKRLLVIKNIGPKTANHIAAVLSNLQPGQPCVDGDPGRLSIPLPTVLTRRAGGMRKRGRPGGWLTLLKDIFGDGYRWGTAFPVYHGAFSVALGYALHQLPDRDREIIVRRYGLEDGETWTLARIAEAQGLSRERIRYIQTRALAKLRLPCHCAILRGFLPPEKKRKKKAPPPRPSPLIENWYPVPQETKKQKTAAATARR